MSNIRIIATMLAAVTIASAATAARAQQPAGEGQQTAPPPNVPAPGEPRAQERLPEAPPEEVLKSPPPIEKNAPPPAEPAKPAPPLPNTLPPVEKQVEPKVPNT